MCCIIIKPKGVNLSLDILEKIWRTNPHGAGFMYADSRSLNVVTGMMTLNDFMNEYTACECKHEEVVIHFRLASAGAIIPEQTHPFWVFNEELAFVHNGHMINFDEGGIKQSDTMSFNDKILTKLPHDFPQNEAIMELLDSYIESSVMVFMDKIGNIFTVGDTSCSIEQDEVWYSNDYWESSTSESGLDMMEEDELICEKLLEINPNISDDKKLLDNL